MLGCRVIVCVWIGSDGLCFDGVEVISDSMEGMQIIWVQRHLSDSHIVSFNLKMNSFLLSDFIVLCSECKVVFLLVQKTYKYNKHRYLTLCYWLKYHYFTEANIDTLNTLRSRGKQSVVQQ